MNLMEGTRRLALLVGVAGAIFGGVASYLELQTVLERRASHNRFEKLVNSDVVKQERKCRLLGYASGCSQITLPQDLTPDQAIQTLRGLPEDRQRAILALLSPEVKQRILAKLQTDTPPPQKFNPNAAYTAAPKYTIENADGTPLASEINKGGISTIHWAKDYSVESIESEPNLYLYPTQAPSAWTYLLIALFPILGFFIPWGAVRAIGWVGAGFVAGPK